MVRVGPLPLGFTVTEMGSVYCGVDGKYTAAPIDWLPSGCFLHEPSVYATTDPLVGAPFSGYVHGRCTCGGFGVSTKDFLIGGKGGLSVDNILHIDFGMGHDLVTFGVREGGSGLRRRPVA